MHMQRVTMTLLLTGVLGSGCVSAGTHKAKLDELQQALADLAKSRQEAVDSQQRARRAAEADSGRAGAGGGSIGAT
jgi:outer membrane murein-binding lipoprotein Lpp